MTEEEDLQNFIEFCDSEFGKKIMAAEALFIKKYLKGCKNILDVGCGIGIFEQLLPDLNITGLDSSKLFLTEAKKRSEKKFIAGNADDLPFKDGEFDGLFCVTTLEFIEDYKAVVREMSRVLQPGGKIVVMMLNHYSEYFKEHTKSRASYFNRIKHRNMHIIRSYSLNFFKLDRRRYFLGIQQGRIFDTEDERLAALTVISGTKER